MKKIVLWLSMLSLASWIGCRSADRRSAATSEVPSALATLSERRVPEHAPAPIVPHAPSAAAIETPRAERAWVRPFLYRGSFKHKDVYVFGTIHLPDPRLDTFPSVLQSAIAESEVVFTEIPMDDATQTTIAPTLMLPEGQSLAQLVPSALYNRVAAAFTGEGIPFEPFDKMKPWAVSVQLSVLDRLMTLALKQPLDALIYQRAQDHGKKTDAIETAREQLSIFDGLKYEEQVELLRLAMDYRDSARSSKRDVLAELLNAYVLGDEVGITKLVREAFDPKNALSFKLMTRTITDRNRSMADRILARLATRPERKLFFAVGCGHVVGADGIVARLRKRELELTRVAAP